MSSKGKTWKNLNTKQKLQNFNKTIEEIKTNPDECWEWSGKRTVRGYGTTASINGETRAHRIVYAQKYGTIPEGLIICHHCDNPSCVNINHLYLGTHKDNTKDMIERGRHNNQSGYRHSEQTRKLISEKVKSNPNRRVYTPLSEEQKQKISIANKGRKFSEEFKAKVSYNKTGTTHTEETRNKISESLKQYHANKRGIA